MTVRQVCSLSVAVCAAAEVPEDSVQPEVCGGSNPSVAMCGDTHMVHFHILKQLSCLDDCKSVLF